MRSRIAVLASGGGSNLQSILDHFERLGERRGGNIALVASDRAAAGALDRARRCDIPVGVLAGYLRLVPAATVAKYSGRIVNVHPALLPAFGGPGMYGQRVHQAVVDAGVRVTGVTAHFVDEVYDRGRIIAQWPVPVYATDDAASVAARVLRVEHLVYPRVVDAVASGRTTLENCVTRLDSGAMDVLPSFTLLAHEDSRLAENIDLSLGC